MLDLDSVVFPDWPVKCFILNVPVPNLELVWEVNQAHL